MRQTSSSTRPPPSPSSAAVTLAVLLWLAVTSSSLPDDLPVTSPNISPAAAAAAAAKLPDPLPSPWRAGRLGDEGQRALPDGARRAQERRGERGEAGGASDSASEGREEEGNGTRGDAEKTGKRLWGETWLERNVSEVSSMTASHERSLGRQIRRAPRFHRQLGIVLVLTEVKVWAYGNEITVSSNRHETLNNFETYRDKLLKEEPHLANDNTALITRQAFENAGGLAFTGMMCKDGLSAVLVRDDDRSSGLIGHILAHELGHSLGMKHDEEEEEGGAGEGCGCRAGACLMKKSVPHKYDPTQTWSLCSRQYLRKQRQSNTLGCLANIPTKPFPGASCGNGIVEEGEQCDCGLPEFCRNRCCDAATCRLTANATCASGACCDTDTCKPRPAGAECRAARGECDLPEFCHGNSETCPDDLHKRDGTPCMHERGHCYSGRCGSHDGRCREVWSQPTWAASPTCFARLNTEGSEDGNCGLQRNQFVPCDRDSVMCGTLHCTPRDTSLTGLPWYHYNYTREVESTRCSFVIGAEIYPSSHWLSPDGAKCAEGKMCVNQRCVAVPAADGARQCPGNCSGHGVCNNKNQCHCDPGFTPPDCARPGMGGSVDSGPASRPSRDGSTAALVLCVLFVLLLTLAAALFCAWGRLRRCWEKQGREKVSAIAPRCASCIDTCCCPLVSKITHWMVTVGPLGKRPRTSRKEIHTVDVSTATESGRTICQVDLDFEGRQRSRTNSWGVANERLVTEIVTLEPKNSPELHRKVQLPSDSSSLKSVDSLKRPKYMQSVSVDSGCVLDADENSLKDSQSSNVSMRSLVSLFSKFGTKGQGAEPDKGSRRSVTMGEEKAMPLSRIVVDPYINNRRSRHGTPPPIPTQPPVALRPAYGRSISTDVPASRGRPAQPPPMPPANTKPNQGRHSIPDAHSKLASNLFIQTENQKRRTSSSSSCDSVQSNGRVRPVALTASTQDNDKKTPMKPPAVPRPTSRTSPAREPPSLPPLAETSETNAKKPLRLSQQAIPSAAAARPPFHSAGRGVGGSSTARTHGARPEPGKPGKADSQNTAKNKKVMDLARKFEQK
nr:uncharacterized protein LOC113820718 isoform X1 [Penaeus vannamei]XP_027228863.1 uncharacterized protein LOC113820718 isoform X1 [Penaeus vannamei]XP_027228864.1 uncharacterized protein LOC113820718 isoform X1 [Penaeus vannamei]XP_027228865.1 uncharacterized protein LOC113820718 isoform X1 [Penaeus vannamei]